MSINNLWTGKGIVKVKKTFVIKDPRGDYEVTDITLEIERDIKGVPKITLVPIEAWGAMSKMCQNLQEGDTVTVEGHFENKHWKNKKMVETNKNVITLEKINKS